MARDADAKTVRSKKPGQAPEEAQAQDQAQAQGQDQAQDQDPGQDNTLLISVLLHGLSKRGGKPNVLRIPDIRMAENASNLKTLLLEVPELCHISSSSHLETIPVAEVLRKGKKRKSKAKQGAALFSHLPQYDGAQVLDDAQPLGCFEALVRGDPVIVVPDPYNLTSAWDHVSHLLSVLKAPPGPLVNATVGDAETDLVPEGGSETNSVQDPGPSSEEPLGTSSQEGNADSTSSGLKQQREAEAQYREMLQKMPKGDLPVPFRLESFFGGESQDQDGVPEQGARTDKTKVPRCLNELLPSVWNPPPPQRKLAGDLLYLRVVTVDGQVLHLTGNRYGFYINQSNDTEFRPEATGTNPSHAQTLAETLALASSSFSVAYEELLRAGAQRAKQFAAESGLIDFDIASFGASSAWSENTSSVNSSRKTSWIVRDEDDEQSRDAVLSLQTSFGQFGLTAQAGAPRDWNEDYQTCLELPCSTMEDRIVRGRLLERFYVDFAENAKQGAIAIVEGGLEPLNPSDPPDSHVYVYNSAFFSIAKLPTDNVSEQDEGDAGPLATYSSANQDLHGVLSMNASLEYARAAQDSEAETSQSASAGKDIHTLGTVIVDYLGKRIIVQTIVPGILQNDQHDSLLYGSVDQGQTVTFNQDVDKKVESIVSSLHLGAGKVRHLADDSKVETLHLPVNTKGLSGSDGRLYLLDLIGLTPVDLNAYPEGVSIGERSDYLAVLRPELVTAYVRSQQVAHQTERKRIAQEIVQQFRDKRNDAKDKSDKPATEAHSEHDAEQVEEWDKETREQIEATVKAALEEVPQPEALWLDPNLFSPNQNAEDRDSKAEEKVRALSAFLVEEQIPRLVHDLRRGSTQLVDGRSLVKTLHSYGINLRYLGKVAALCLDAEETTIRYGSAEVEDGSVKQIAIPIPPVSKCAHELCEIEMIARAVKWLFRRTIAFSEALGASAWQPPNELITKLLNAVFYKASKETDATREESAVSWLASSEFAKGAQGKGLSKGAPLVQAHICEYVQRHFAHNIKWWFDANTAEESRQSKTTLLRRICQLNGFTVFSRTVETFKPSDIASVGPVVKSCRPEWCLPEVRDLLETSKLHLQMQSKPELQKACALANEALALVCQVSGPAHHNAALCCVMVANVMQSAGDMQVALEQQKRALALLTILGERDAAIVANTYSGLASLYQAQGALDKAVQCLRRAIYLHELMAGPRNAEGPILYQRIATIYASTGNLQLACEAIQQSISRCGNNEIQKARYLRTAAHFLANGGNFWPAFQMEKAAYTIFKQVLGPEDPRTAECFKSVEHYTRLSVEKRTSEEGAE